MSIFFGFGRLSLKLCVCNCVLTLTAMLLWVNSQVAIPTSVGYGMSLGGVSALLTMLNSCSPGVGCVNIDNGFGGAVWAMKCLNSRQK